MSMKTIQTILILILLGLLATSNGCKKEEPAAKDGATQQKISDLEQKINQIDLQIDELKGEMKDEHGEIKIQYKKELAHLKELRDSLYQNVIDMKNAGLRTLDRARPDIDAAMNNVNRAIRSLTEELRKDKSVEPTKGK
jgi:F0F1-type ATP synthase membrane subunit b/b'